MLVSCEPKALSKEVAKMAKKDNQNVAEICRQEDIVRGILFNDTLHRMCWVVLRGVSKGAVATVSKFGMDSRKHLLRGWRHLGVREAILVLLVFVKYRIFR